MPPAGEPACVPNEKRAREAESAEHARRVRMLRLSMLFGALAFLQGINEPTEGLPAQPTRSLLKSVGWSAGAIAAFSATVAIPWLLKPLFGLASDFLPLAGSRRRSYLVVSSLLMLATFSVLSSVAACRKPGAVLAAWLTAATASVALADVVSDALMVEIGQALNATGRFQAVQWASSYASGIVVGIAGGELSQRHREALAFPVCAVAAGAMLCLSLGAVREPSGSKPPSSLRGTLALLVQGSRWRTLAGVGLFLFLWNFNPFSNAVLHIHMTQGLGFSESFYGLTVSVTAIASIVASVGYALVSRRFGLRPMLHASIVLGVLSTLSYALVVDERSALVVTGVSAVGLMIATLIQLDLAARVCPPVLAATVFATLMAVENLAAVLATWIGGVVYERGLGYWGAPGSFRALLVLSASFTACSWLVLPLLRNVDPPSETPGSPSPGG